MKLLFVLDQVKDGGAQALACDLAAGLASLGVQCRVAALHSSCGCIGDVGAPVDVLGGPPRTGAWLGACARLIGLCRRHRPDIIHGHAEVADLAGRIAGVRLGIPNISTAHNLRPWNWRPKLGMLIERRTARMTRVHVAVSEAIACMLRDELRVPPERIRVIPNWEPARQAPQVSMPLPKPGHPTIVHVARLHAQKRQDILLRAFAEVRRTCPLARLWIAGTGPDKARLRQLAGDGVEFLGHREDVKHLLGNANLFVLSSDWEGMPLSILEAMSHGLPVVATAVGGVPEIVEEGKTGMLVPPGDSGALARAMIACIQDPARAMAMGAEGRRLCHGRRERGLSEYLRCYEDVLRQAASRRS